MNAGKQELPMQNMDKYELLDELNRLRRLLEQEHGADEIPMLDEVMDEAMADDDSGVPSLDQVVNEAVAGDGSEIPLLDQVMDETVKSSAAKMDENSEQMAGMQILDQDELQRLIGILVERQLRKLRPMLRRELLQVLLQRYPALRDHNVGQGRKESR